MVSQDIAKSYLLGLIDDMELITLLFFQKEFPRFTKSEIRRLVHCSDLDGTFKSAQRYKFTGLEGLYFAQRLAYPCRLYTVSRIFKRGQTAISSIFNWVLNHIDHNFGHLLEDLDQQWLTRAKLFEFPNAMESSGSFIKNIWGFIDGTARDICRPVRNQHQYYSGHKRKHCVKYQSVMCPNGIICRLNGPYIGRRHDSFLLELSKLVPEIGHFQKFKLPDDRNFHLYGDTGYANTKYILTNFRNPQDGDERSFNKRMAELRVVVEWGLGKISTLFSFVDFRKNQKLLLQPVGKYYRVATILTNCHVCLNGRPVGDSFNLSPPKLEEYLLKLC